MKKKKGKVRRQTELRVATDGNGNIGLTVNARRRLESTALAGPVVCRARLSGGLLFSSTTTNSLSPAPPFLLVRTRIRERYPTCVALSQFRTSFPTSPF